VASFGSGETFLIRVWCGDASFHFYYNLNRYQLRIEKGQIYAVYKYIDLAATFNLIVPTQGESFVIDDVDDN